MEHVEQDGFIRASSSSEWYDNLQRNGSCLRLYDLLAERRELIHELGPEGITVLHKGVDHGCVKLVRFILVDMFDNVDGHCTCGLQGGDNPCPLTREGLLRKTSEYGSTAVNMAVVSGSPKMVVLLKWAIDVSNADKQKESEIGGRWVEYVDSIRVPAMRSRYLREKAALGEERVEDINEAEQPIAHVPNVKDDVIYEEVYGEGLSTRISKVYELMEEKVLNKDWGDLQEEMDILKDNCKKNVDFEFVPIAHVFLHFLLSIWDFFEDDKICDLLGKIFQSIILVCEEHDCEEVAANGESLVVALFQILDPRGRTFIHLLGTYIDYENPLWRGIKNLEEFPTLISSTIMKKCMNVRDGAGRTVGHVACIRGVDLLGEDYEWMIKYIDWDVILYPFCAGEFCDLIEWCFPTFGRVSVMDVNPTLLAIVFDTFNVEFLWQFNLECIRSMNKRYDTIYFGATSFSISAVLGRASIVEKILEHYSKFKAIDDSGFAKDLSDSALWPAVHCATISGQVETLQTILKHPIYDPICQHPRFGTALHFLLNPPSDIPLMRDIFEHFKTIALLHVLPNSYLYKRIENDFTKHQINDGAPRMFTSNEVSCINLLLQVGIDLWTPHCRTGEHPTPGPKANNEARKWWYDKVVNEVVTQKARITNAANATSVISALVATTSVIGPLQPPLSYSGDGGFVDTTRRSVRVYLVCNSLSFFFSIASILMVVLPTIPVPMESMYDEFLRSQRSLKAPVVMLLISIICTLISFSSASMAVVSSDWSNRNLVVIIFGGVICAAVIVLYIIRLLAMVFHKNNRFRRFFTQYAYF